MNRKKQISDRLRRLEQHYVRKASDPGTEVNDTFSQTLTVNAFINEVKTMFTYGLEPWIDMYDGDTNCIESFLITEMSYFTFIQSLFCFKTITNVTIYCWLRRPGPEDSSTKLAVYLDVGNGWVEIGTYFTTPYGDANYHLQSIDITSILNTIDKINVCKMKLIQYYPFSAPAFITQIYLVIQGTLV